jgi:lipid-binding SYLF domain-containing protein
MRMPMAVVLAFSAMLLPAAGRNKTADRLEDAAVVLSEIMGSPDRGIPEDLLRNAQCIVIVPGLKKGGFIVGAEYGRGFVSCRKSKGGWSAPAAVRVEGGSFGFQVGGSETDLVMIVMNERGAQKLMSSRFTLGAESEVAAGPVGRASTAQTDAFMRAEILSWSRSRGVFAGISLKGATLRQDTAGNVDLYNKRLDNKRILSGAAAPPPAAAHLLSLLNKYSPRKKA